jgi:hypothetical protein
LFLPSKTRAVTTVEHNYDEDTGCFYPQKQEQLQLISKLSFHAPVVFTLKNKSSYNTSKQLLYIQELFLPSKTRAVTTYKP